MVKAGKLKVKAWIIDREQKIARNYNVWIDCVDRTTDEYGMLAPDENGYYTVITEDIYEETEKAVHLRLASGLTDGSYKGWKMWIPKSQISEI